MSDGNTAPIAVLIVDNDTAHAETVAESLEAAGGYRCSVATSGAQGVKRIETDTFDVIITDLVMNDVDGTPNRCPRSTYLPKVSSV